MGKPISTHPLSRFLRAYSVLYAHCEACAHVSSCTCLQLVRVSIVTRAHMCVLCTRSQLVRVCIVLTLPASQTPRSHHSSSAEAPLAISSSPRISWPLSKAIGPPRSSPAASPRVLRGISQPSLSPSHPYVGDHRGGVADGRDGGGWGQGEPYQATEGRQSTNPPPIISRPPSSPPNLNEFVDNATDAQVIRAD